MDLFCPESRRPAGEGDACTTRDHQRSPWIRMMRLAAALGLCAAAFAAPPAGWKTCGGLPDNYSNTACDVATSTVRLPRSLPRV